VGLPINNESIAFIGEGSSFHVGISRLSSFELSKFSYLLNLALGIEEAVLLIIFTDTPDSRAFM